MRGDGKLFSFDLLDASGVEIRATAFNEQADKYCELLEVGRVYRCDTAAAVSVVSAALQPSAPLRPRFLPLFSATLALAQPQPQNPRPLPSPNPSDPPQTHNPLFQTSPKPPETHQKPHQNLDSLSRASLVPKKPQFNHTAHEYEIRLERATEVEAAAEDADTARARRGWGCGGAVPRGPEEGRGAGRRALSFLFLGGRWAPAAPRRSSLESFPSKPLPNPRCQNPSLSRPLQIPRAHFDFRPIAELEGAPAGAFFDVLGVVEGAEKWQTITRRTGEETRKRAVVVRDASGRSVEVTLWGDYAITPGASPWP